MLSLLLYTHLAEAKPKKSKVPPPPPLGWYKEEGWKGECYYPPNYEALGEGDRKIARQVSLEEMKKQWLGAREDGVKFEDMMIDEVDTVLLGRPVKIEDVSRLNLEQCQAAMKGGPSEAWQGYLSALPAKLTAGECLRPFDYQLFDYLDVGKGWQRPVGVCKGDKVHIIGTVKDRYRISDTGAWINVEGVPGEKAVGAEYPCNIEGCMVGMLVGKFVSENGVETIFPIGVETVFTAPDHGELSYSINDTVWYDNKWFKSATIEDKTAITLEPG